MNKNLWLAVAMGVTVAACTPGVPVASPDDLDPAALVAGRLEAFDSCDALLAHIKDEASDRVGPYGLDTSGWPPFWRFADDTVEMTTAAAESAAFDNVGGRVSESSAVAPGVATAEGADGDFTGTNTQEADVDEPDIVKTDGSRILTISENILTYTDVTGGEPVITDNLRFEEGWAHELFFAGNRAFVITNGGLWGYPMPIEGDGVASDSVAVDSRIGIPEMAPPAAILYEIDLSDPSNLQVASTLRLEGSYLSARSVGNTVRMAVTTAPTSLPWVYPANQSGEERAEESNRQLIEETTIDDWIPEYTLDSGGESESGRMVECPNLYRPAEFAGFDVVSVLSFDLAEGLTPGAGTGVLAGGQTVYSSLDRFYVATTKWVGEEVTDETGMVQFNEDYTTQIHAFDNTGAAAAYLASGEVEGSLLNQFSMDEHDGYLRVITTDGSPWSDTEKSESFLTVFEEQEELLVEVGKVGGLGKGESLYSARLLDDVGFAVTFRQIDPFYVLDLSDPTNPTVTGELKIPGFSTYLHPVGDDRVLGIGQDATEDGGVTGLKVSLFSVADRANPLEVATWVVPNANSAAEYDHRAFQYLPEQGIAILPAATWDGSLNGAVLLEVGTDSITEIGQVTHVIDTGTPTSDCTQLTPDDFEPESSELYYLTGESGGRVQVCEPGDTGGFGSYYCDPIPLAQIDDYWGVPTDDVSELESRFAPDSTLEICWPDDSGWRQQINRSIVIGDILYTTSIGHLQANNLETLEVVGKVSITG